MSKKQETPAECNEGLGQSRGRASNAGLGSSAPKGTCGCVGTCARERGWQYSGHCIVPASDLCPHGYVGSCSYCEQEVIAEMQHD